MKQLSGIPHNINETIIGRISKKRNFIRINPNIVLVTKEEDTKGNFAGVVTNQKPSGSKKGVFCVNELDELNENDIVTIDCDGRINVVHEVNSSHNALFLTARCNSNCIMCPQPPVSEESDRYNIILKQISLLTKKTNSIGITGGEPTLIGPKLFDIIKLLRKRLPKAYVSLLSNGIKFSNIEFVRDYAMVSDQRILTEIPLYSDVDSIHNKIVGSNTFYKTIQGIYNLAKFDLKIGLRVVIHKLNYERLSHLAEFIYRNFPFVYQISLMQMEPTGNALINIDELWIDPFDYNEELTGAIRILHFRGLHVSIYNSQLCVLPQEIRKFAVRSISDWKNIYLDECSFCSLKTNCPGFFDSSKKYHSRRIKSIKENTD